MEDKDEASNIEQGKTDPREADIRRMLEEGDTEMVVSSFLELQNQVVELSQEVGRLKDTSERDPLTGLLNRRGLVARGERMVSHSLRTGEELVIMACDVDNLKKINDEWGHEAGDAVIRIVANALRESSRQEDTIARTGGDEFGGLLPETNLKAAKTWLDRVNNYLREKARGDLDNNLPDKSEEERTEISRMIGISVGFAQSDKEKKESMGEIFNRADLEAKRVKDEKKVGRGNG